MVTIIKIFKCIVILSIATTVFAVNTAESGEVKTMLDNIKWLGHAGFLIKTNQMNIYIDPWEVDKKYPEADIILITHPHYDHLSTTDIKRLQNKNTIIVATADTAAKLTGNLKVVQPGDKLQVEGISIEVVPAYNINKQYHPKENAWVGYIIEIEGANPVRNKTSEVSASSSSDRISNRVKIYHAGDTDFIPEMNNIETDIALLPIGGTYTMNAEQAAQAANTIKPKVVIPMHYGTIVGGKKDLEKFRQLCKIKVEVKG